MADRELEFSKKPRRMTKQPQNQRKWLPGYEGVEVKLETDPGRIAYFAREATWGDLMAEPTGEELADTLAEVASGRVLGSAYKAGLGFRIRASRSTMDQALRLAEGSGGAGSGAGAQTTRDNDQRDFNIIVPNTIEALAYSKIVEGVGSGLIGGELYSQVSRHITEARRLYGALVDAGVPPQDARYVALPLGFQTQWMWIMSIGNMTKLCEHRLCGGLVQHETAYLVRKMRDLTVEKYHWTDQLLRSSCEKRGACTTGGMLFPPCGAYGGVSTKYNPDKHLYPTGANDAMSFVPWDIERQQLEAENPEIIYSMAGPPVEIARTA